MRLSEDILQGKHPVLEAFRAKRTVEKLFVQKGNADNILREILSNAKKTDAVISFVEKVRLDEMSPDGKHQGVIAYTSEYKYAEVPDILAAAREKDEPPFILLLDSIQDPHNLGAMIRTAYLAGMHGVIIPERRSAGLTATVGKASAGAVNYIPIARCVNLTATIKDLKKEGLWFACADMGGELMYRAKLTGALGVVIGSEGEGVGRLVKEACDFHVSIPMFGQIEALNASVAMGVLVYEIVRQKTYG
jgi:23S rRNA (guanosine2251-2'-O)-methyltransferase